MLVNSSGKPINEGSSDLNKDITASKVESKQSSSDSRPKEGWHPKPSFNLNLLDTVC